MSTVIDAQSETDAVVRLDNVHLRTESAEILRNISLEIRSAEFWVLLGRNGAGKTSLLRLCGAQRVPSSGKVEVLGKQLGRTDLRSLRRDVALVSQAIENQIRAELTTFDIVLAGKDGSLVPWWGDYSASDRARADWLLSIVGLQGPDASKQFSSLSTGERKRAMLARALMSGSRLLLMDEPLAGLDLGAREHLLELICQVFFTHAETAILVTHHLEEIPTIASHAALVDDGQVTISGPITEVLTSSTVSECFGRPVEVHHREGRWYAGASTNDAAGDAGS